MRENAGRRGRAGVPSRLSDAVIRALCRQGRRASWETQPLSIVRSLINTGTPEGEKTAHSAFIRQGAHPQAKVRLQSFWALLPHL